MSTIDLGDGKTAVVDFEYTEKMRSRLPSTKPHRETKVKIVVRQGEVEIGYIEASAFCSPMDQFVKGRGRVLAIRKAFENDKDKAILSDTARAAIASTLIIPTIQKNRK